MHLNPQAKEKWIALVRTKLTVQIHAGLYKNNNLTKTHKTMKTAALSLMKPELHLGMTYPDKKTHITTWKKCSQGVTKHFHLRIW